MKHLIRLSAVFASALMFAAPSFAKVKRDRPVTRWEILNSTHSLTLQFPGIDGPIPYQKFGRFEGVGTKSYKYVIEDKNGLSDAAGEGIFPNKDVTRDKRYQELLKAGRLQGNHWKFVDSADLEVNFYKWASTNEDPGVKQYYTGLALERLGMIEEAIKAYYATVVHFPKTVSWTYYNTPWYIGPSAIDRLDQLVRRHPELGLRYIPGKITVVGKFDNDPKNDEYIVDPGRLVKGKHDDGRVNLRFKRVVETRGGKHGLLKKYSNGHWQFFVNGKPFPIRSITYSVTPIGASPDRRTWNVSRDWQLLDTNKDGVHDGFFQSWVDKNGDSVQDADEPAVGDAELLRRMGVNTLRAYHHVYDKELFRRLHKEYGIHVQCGDLLGAYAVDSGATWDVGTDYEDETQQNRMLENVRRMVEEYKDEPYVIMWVLGNENVYGVANNALKKPEAFFKLVNRAAKLIKELDPTRPVGISNGDLLYLDIIKKHCPDIDIMGANVYRGEHGFGRHVYTDVKDYLDRPFMVTEYGASAIAEGYTNAVAEAYQAMYLANNWDDLEANMAGRGVGNALGGTLFEWMDEWWKANSDLPEAVQLQRAEWYADKSDIYKSLQPENHDAVPQFGFPFLDGWSYEEWYGVVAQGNGRTSPFCRQLRPAYFTLENMWNPKKK